MDDITIVTEYLKSLREEIHLRISEHTRLVQIKIISLAAVIAFIVEKIISDGTYTASPLICLVWMVPLAAIVFDTMIAGNIKDINSLGVYIRDYIERLALAQTKQRINAAENHGPLEFGFWEEKVAQAKDRCYRWFDVLVIWLFSATSLLFCFILQDKFPLTGWLCWSYNILGGLCTLGVVLAGLYLWRAVTTKRRCLYMDIGNVPGVGWQGRGEEIVESMPPLETAGYVIRFVQLSPHVKYTVEGKEIIVCLLRGTLKGKHALELRKSLHTAGRVSFESGSEGCLLFVCVDQGVHYNGIKDNISGLQIDWSKFDSDMYRTLPQLHVDRYRINLWYLGPNKHGGIHNHNAEEVPFVEFHTQLRGGGWMVKYEDKEGKKERERIDMPIGYTHDLFCTPNNWQPVYPWHEYIAGHEGSLFIVFEDTAI